MFEPNLPPEDGQNQKQLSSYPNESKSRPYLLSIFNENYSSFQICVFPSFSVVFYTSWQFFWLWTYFQVPHPKDGKSQLNFQIRTLCWIFWKKVIKKIEYSRSLWDSENYWWDHQQSCNFFPISRHFPITQENEISWFEAEKFTVTGKIFFYLIISKGKIFTTDRKKSLYC